MPTRPIGTLTRKIGRQWLPAMSAETSSPPNAWPSDRGDAGGGAVPPNARAREVVSPVAWMVASVCGTTSAAAAPWSDAGGDQPRRSARVRTAGEANVKAAMPAVKTRRRPQASPMRPPTTRKHRVGVA